MKREKLKPILEREPAPGDFVAMPTRGAGRVSEVVRGPFVMGEGVHASTRILVKPWVWRARKPENEPLSAVYGVGTKVEMEALVARYDAQQKADSPAVDAVHKAYAAAQHAQNEIKTAVWERAAAAALEQPLPPLPASAGPTRQQLAQAIDPACWRDYGSVSLLQTAAQQDAVKAADRVLALLRPADEEEEVAHAA